MSNIDKLFPGKKIVCSDEKYFDKVLAFAQETKQVESLRNAISRLGRDENDELFLYKDFAPYSFEFVLKRKGEALFNGGIIYHGSHDGGGNGDAPTYSVSLSPTQGWSVHT